MSTGNITQSLHIPKDALVGRLQEVANEAAAKRQDAADATKASRQSLLDAVGKLTADQVANILHNQICSDVSELEKKVNSWVEEGKYVSIELAPTAVETALERTIRVLSMASDKEIEVKPTDEVYAYL